MAVILVLSFFAIFVAIDLYHNRRERKAIAAEGRTLHERALDSEPHWVAGYQLPEHLHYHQGHTWVHWVSPDQAYVGVDDFARRLMGRQAKWNAPSVGTWVRQGDGAIQAATESDKHHKKTRIASPLTGEIVATNPKARNGSESVHREPYGNGWLYKIRSPHLAEQLESLLHGSLANRWVEDVRERFQNRLVLATGNVIQDGGTTVDSLDEVLEDEVWSEMVDEFLSTQNQSR